MEPASDTDIPLARTLGLASATMLGVGAMIGAGIFVLIGHAAGLAGPAVLIAFALNAAGAVVVGSCYAELACAIPRTGGAYVWVGEAIGPGAGFVAGWVSWLAQTVACSLYALGFGSFATTLISDAGLATPYGTGAAFAVVLAVGLGTVNARGASETGLAEIVVTSAKLVLLAIVVAYGLGAVLDRPAPLAPFTPLLPEGTFGVIMAMGLIFVAFEGYEVIAQTREEVTDPERTLPLAIFLSIAISCAFYLGVGFVLIGAIEPPPGVPAYVHLGRLGEMGLVEAAGQFVPFGRIVLLAAGLASTASALNATLYSSSRICFAMARGGDLPALLARVEPARRTPANAIWMTVAIVCAVALVVPLRDVAAAADVLFILLFCGVCVAVIRLRQTQPLRPRPFRVPFSPLLPASGIAGGLFLAGALANLSPASWVIAAIVLALGAALSRPRNGRSPLSPGG